MIFTEKNEKPQKPEIPPSQIEGIPWVHVTPEGVQRFQIVDESDIAEIEPMTEEEFDEFRRLIIDERNAKVLKEKAKEKVDPFTLMSDEDLHVLADRKEEAVMGLSGIAIERRERWKSQRAKEELARRADLNDEESQ